MLDQIAILKFCQLEGEMYLNASINVRLLFLEMHAFGEQYSSDSEIDFNVLILPNKSRLFG